MDDKFDCRAVLDDARARHSAVVNLIYFTDTQALGLMRLYVPLGTAAVVGIAAAFSKNPPIPPLVGWALVGAVLSLLVASVCCFRAMNAATINLPGRNADFWLWALDPAITNDEVMKTYLEGLNPKNVMNDGVNKRTAPLLQWAKIWGAASPLVALVAFLIAVNLR